jgi:hypothetical protein
MAAVHTLALTDDEAAVIAVHAGGAWRTPLPTVDETSEADLAAAILRGRRSLAVRDLAQPDGTAKAEAAQVLAALGTGPCAAFMLVDANDGWFAAGLTVYLYGAVPDQADLSHVVAAGGVHYFRLKPAEGQWLALTELAEAVFDDGFAENGNGAPPPAAALLSVVRDGSVRTVRVARGAASPADEPDAPEFPNLAEAVAWLGG